MSPIYLRRSDETVKEILSLTFPEYRGTQIKAVVSDRVRLYNTQWDEGNRREYQFLDLRTKRVVPIPEAPYTKSSPIHENPIAIEPGIVVVVLVQAGSRSYLEIISPAENIQPLLESPQSLSDDERTVLAATAGFKSSYQGISNYRFHEARRATGITLERYESAKSSLKEKKLLNKAGAITPEGRNALGSYRIY